MLREVVLDLRHHVPSPRVERLVRQAFVDPEEAVVAHEGFFDHFALRSNGPTGLILPVADRPGGPVTIVGVTDQPRPTPEEEDAPLERREEEDATRGPGHEDPEKQIDPDPEAE